MFFYPPPPPVILQLPLSLVMFMLLVIVMVAIPLMYAWFELSHVPFQEPAKVCECCKKVEPDPEDDEPEAELKE